jgi:hypothetical protein
MADAKAREAGLEQAFALIEQGNEALDSGEYWGASDAFCQAYETLLQLSSDVDVCDTQYGGAKQDPKQATTDDLGKIVLLYKQQANEYRARARKCFVQALEKDSDEDFASIYLHICIPSPR